jgi:hypothetical protein
MRRAYWVLVIAGMVACSGEKPGDDARGPDSIGAGQAADTTVPRSKDSTALPADTVMARDTATQM